MGSPFFIVMWLLSLGFTVLFAVALSTIIYRSWQKIRAPEEESPGDRILDHLDQMQTQLYGMSERLQRMEERMMLPPGSESGPEPPGPDEN